MASAGLTPLIVKVTIMESNSSKPTPNSDDTAVTLPIVLASSSPRTRPSWIVPKCFRRHLLGLVGTHVVGVQRCRRSGSPPAPASITATLDSLKAAVSTSVCCADSTNWLLSV